MRAAGGTVRCTPNVRQWRWRFSERWPARPLHRLRQCVVATTEEILARIEREKLHDYGYGSVDIALLASARLTPGTKIWTKDKRLDALARCLGVSFSVAGY